MTPKVHLQYRDTAFSRRMVTFAIVNQEHNKVEEFLNEAYIYFERELRRALSVHQSVKVSGCFNATFEKKIVRNDNDDDEEDNRVVLKEKQTLYIHTKYKVVLRNSDLHHMYKQNVMTIILQRIEDAILLGSGFTLSSINELLVQVNKYDPLNGSSYIKLPNYLHKKKAIINVKNNDNMCFKFMCFISTAL